MQKINNNTCTYLLQKTRAFHRLDDDIQTDIKKRRANELVSAFRHEAEKLNKNQIGSIQHVLVEGVSSLDGTAIALFIHVAIYSSVFMRVHTSGRGGRFIRWNSHTTVYSCCYL